MSMKTRSRPSTSRKAYKLGAPTDEHIFHAEHKFKIVDKYGAQMVKSLKRGACWDAFTEYSAARNSLSQAAAHVKSIPSGDPEYARLMARGITFEKQLERLVEGPEGPPTSRAVGLLSQCIRMVGRSRFA